MKKITAAVLVTAGAGHGVYGKTICSVREMDAAFRNLGAENKTIERENVHKLKGIIEQMAELKKLDKPAKSALLLHYIQTSPDYRKQDKQSIMQKIMMLLSQAGNEEHPDCAKLTEAADMTGRLIDINREHWAKILAGAQQDLLEAKNAR